MQAGGAIERIEEDDPRLAVVGVEQRTFAAGMVEAPLRWAPSGADWMAVELQYGRGVPVEALARWFGVSTARIYARARGDNPAREPWRRHMAEADRRELAWLVWVAGDKLGMTKSSENTRKLKAMSEWRALPPASARAWTPKHADEPRSVNFGQGELGDSFSEGRDGEGRVGDEREWFAGGCYGEADPRRDERIAIRDRINALLAGFDDAAAEAGGGDGAADLAGEPGGVVAAGAGGDGVAGMGEWRPAGAGGEMADVDDDGRARGGQDAGGGGVGEGAGGGGTGAARGAGGADTA